MGWCRHPVYAKNPGQVTSLLPQRQGCPLLDPLKAPVIRAKGAENVPETQLFSPWCRLLQSQRGHPGWEGPSALTEGQAPSVFLKVTSSHVTATHVLWP